MKASKAIVSFTNFKFKTKRTKEILPGTINELIHPRVKVVATRSLGQKAPDSLLPLMYSQENEVLFI